MNAPDRIDAVRVPEDVTGNKLPKISASVDEKITNAVTFKVLREGHTAGNLMRMELLRDYDVKFAGYRLHHPLENDITLKVQTRKSTDPWQAAEAAAGRLQSEFRAMEAKFRAKLQVQEVEEEEQFRLA